MATAKKVPLRKCTGCGEMKNKTEMLRALKPTEGDTLLEATAKKNGRGAYLCRSRECFEKAVKSKGLERSLKCSVPQDVMESLKKEMTQYES